MAEGRATDPITDDLVASYRRGVARLRTLIEQGLKRGLDADRIAAGTALPGDATQAYRERQLAAALQVLDELEQRSARVAREQVRRAYGASVVAVDRSLLAADAADAAAVGRFGGIHAAVVGELSSNMAQSLEQAARVARTNVQTVFARAAELEGALPVSGIANVGFVGRRVDDVWRSAALSELASGTVSLETRRQITGNLVRRLVAEGVTDGVTGFVDRRGARWALDRYAGMVARTTTREAATRATLNRLGEHGLDLVTVSSHANPCPICADFDGQTYSISGDDDRYEVLGEAPPFHPNCLHVLTPADANLDDFEQSLEEAATDTAAAGRPPRQVPPRPPNATADEFDPPPFGPNARPTSTAASAERLADQEAAYAFGDPGPELGADAARRAAQDAGDRAAVRAARRAERDELAALDSALGPDVVAALDEYAKSGVGWAREPELRQALLAGDVDLDYITEQAERELAAREGRRVARAEVESRRGFRTGSFPCFVCGRRKARPADVCDHCGDDPVTYRGDAREFNRAYGFDT